MFVTYCTEKLIVCNKSWAGQFLHVKTQSKGKKKRWKRTWWRQNKRKRKTEMKHHRQRRKIL